MCQITVRLEVVNQKKIKKEKNIIRLFEEWLPELLIRFKFNFE